MPKYAHYCDRCQYLGAYTPPLRNATDEPLRYDLYYCPGDGRSGSVLARYGNDGSEYLSTDVEILIGIHADRDYPLNEALRRQVKLWGERWGVNGVCAMAALWARIMATLRMRKIVNSNNHNQR